MSLSPDLRYKLELRTKGLSSPKPSPRAFDSLFTQPKTIKPTFSYLVSCYASKIGHFIWLLLTRVFFLLFLCFSHIAQVLYSYFISQQNISLISNVTFILPVCLFFLVRYPQKLATLFFSTTVSCFSTFILIITPLISSALSSVVQSFLRPSLFTSTSPYANSNLFTPILSSFLWENKTRPIPWWYKHLSQTNFTNFIPFTSEGSDKMLSNTTDLMTTSDIIYDIIPAAQIGSIITLSLQIVDTLIITQRIWVPFLVLRLFKRFMKHI